MHLPFQGIPLVGRDQAVEEVADLLLRPEVRLLTLTGPGGVGKTQLACYAASTLRAYFPRGIFSVSLASLRESTSVLAAILKTLGITGDDEASGIESLKNGFAAQPALLILDTFEHLLSQAPRLTELLDACPRLKLLVTSRAALRLSYEYHFPVTPLALPDLCALPPAELLAECPSVALFIQRAQMVQPDFHLTPENAPAVAKICARLDGLPLAIELAAARVKLFTPQMLLTRLPQQLSLLTSRTQDRPARHQTLRANLDWSYHLLSEREQRLFWRLAVFEGGCAFQAVESIAASAGDDGSGLLEEMTSLLEKGLLASSQQPYADLRFFLLETIRHYAWERLEESGELTAVRQAHAEYYLRFLEQAEPELEGPEQARWMAMIEQEQRNLRAALTWLLQQPHDQQAREMALRLAGALAPFRNRSGALSEGRALLEQALAGSTALRNHSRAKALLATPGDVLSLPPAPRQRARVASVSSGLAREASPAVPEALTEREIEVFRLLANGLTKPQIAERLTLSFHTVNAHVRSIYAKIGVSSRSAATRYALEHALA